MTGKTIVKRLSGGGVSLDLPMAALAAAAVGFVAYAMPDPLFAGAVEASGLPSVLSAAQPPLGLTARLGVVGAGALATFLGTWLLLRALGNVSSPLRRAREEEEEVSMPPLRLRRVDSHPDAPLRRPLVAGLDLGEPKVEIEEEAIEIPWETSPPIHTEPEPEPFVEAQWEGAEEDVEETVDDHAATLAEPPMELEEPTIAHLMQRLEIGLIRHRQNAWEAPSTPEPPAPISEAPSGVDDRLRSALGDLQRMASRGA